jgi:flagellar basal-body rod protein FlgC
MTIQDSLNIASMGLDTHSRRLQIHAANIANVYTPNYVRQIPVITENTFLPFDEMMHRVHTQGAMAGITSATPEGVRMLGSVSDTTPGKKLYMPYHPEADKEGYITMSNTNVLGDMSDSLIASRMYEANLSMVTIIRNMATKAIELGRPR